MCRLADPDLILEAEMLYYEILLEIEFVMQSIEDFLCYGKRILAMCLGLELFELQPAMLVSQIRT